MKHAISALLLGVATLLALAIHTGGAGLAASTNVKPADILATIRSGKLKVIDCSYTYFEGMPGIKLPPPFANTKTFEITNVSRYDARGPAWYWNWFSIGEHAGTHVDAPNHWISGRDNVGVDRIDIGQLIAPAAVIDVRQKVSANQDYEVTREDIMAWENANGRIPEDAIVVMRSGWGSRWPDPAKFLGIDAEGRPHGPGFGESAADFLLKQRQIVALAVDTVSTEAMGLAGQKQPIPFPVHNMVHGAKKYQIEMLANTDSLPAAGAVLVVAPVKVQNGSGAPARIYALVGS
jgi:kynurenine formamidase